MWAVVAGLYQKSPIFHEQSPIFHQQSPVFHQKRPMFYQRSSHDACGLMGRCARKRNERKSSRYSAWQLPKSACSKKNRTPLHKKSVTAQDATPDNCQKVHASKKMTSLKIFEHKKRSTTTSCRRCIRIEFLSKNK